MYDEKITIKGSLIIRDSMTKIKSKPVMAKKNSGITIIKDTNYSFKTGKSEVKLAKVYKPTNANEKLLRSFLKANGDQSSKNTLS